MEGNENWEEIEATDSTKEDLARGRMAHKLGLPDDTPWAEIFIANRQVMAAYLGLPTDRELWVETDSWNAINRVYDGCSMGKKRQVLGFIYGPHDNLSN